MALHDFFQMPLKLISYSKARYMHSLLRQIISPEHMMLMARTHDGREGKQDMETGLSKNGCEHWSEILTFFWNSYIS